MSKLLIVLLLFPLIAIANQHWKQELASPLVKVNKEKTVMTYDEIELCTVNATNMQVKTHSEAPYGKFISRDNFVAITAIISVGLTEQLGEVNCKTLSEPTGKPDLEINMYMTQSGIQIESTNTNTKQAGKETHQWSEFFAE